ncbi:MAG: hypothetical protein ACI4EW_08700 [Butyrivibrio sp.]
MFVKVSQFLNTLYDLVYKDDGSLAPNHLYAYHQCISLLLELSLVVFRSDSGKHFVCPILSCEDTFSLNGEVFNLVKCGCFFSLQ